MRITALVFCLLFLVFMGFQINDPDPFLWVVFYGNIALLCFMAFRGKFYKWWSVAALVVYSLYFLTLTPSIYTFFTENFSENWSHGMSFDKAYIEKTREAGGLLIALMALTFLHFASKKGSK